VSGLTIFKMSSLFRVAGSQNLLLLSSDFTTTTTTTATATATTTTTFRN